VLSGIPFFGRPAFAPERAIEVPFAEFKKPAGDVLQEIEMF
jgi:hypothetical protein